MDAENHPPTAPSTSRHPILRVVVACLLCLFLPLVGVFLGANGSFDHLTSLREAGWWIFPTYLLVGGTLVGFALIPSHLTSLVAGLLFGFAAGLPVSIGIVLIGCGIGHLLGRRYAGDGLRSLVDRSRSGKKLAAAMIDAPPGRAILAVALARLPPQMPFAMTNVLAASSGVRFVPLLLGTAIGMAPRIGLVVWVGAELTGWTLGEPIPVGLIAAIGGAVVGFGGLAIWSWRLLRRPDAAPEPTVDFSPQSPH